MLYAVPFRNVQQSITHRNRIIEKFIVLQLIHKFVIPEQVIG